VTAPTSEASGVFGPDFFVSGEWNEPERKKVVTKALLSWLLE
jgi:hypothetical protein